MPDPVTLFWYRDTNFGDALNRILLPSFGQPVCWSSPAEADFVGIGSLLIRVPTTFAGMILGAGFIGAQQHRSFKNADFQIVRGRHTAERSAAPSSTCLGDPGLLVNRFLSQPAAIQHSLGLIPHYVDKNHPGILKLAERYPEEILLIDIRGTAQEVLTAISSCAVIASSSLHGLIAADALEKPNLWLVLSNNICGGEFKYRDYYSAFLPDDQIRDPIRLQGDESLRELLDRCIAPGNEVKDVAARIEELLLDLFPHDRNAL